MKSFTVLASLEILILANFIFCVDDIQFYDQDLYLGDDCRTHDGLQGTCVKIQDCLGVRSRSELVKCGFEKMTPIVCCALQLDIDVRINVEEYIPFQWECKVNGTTEDGRLIRKQFCPDGDRLPKVCNYEICKDLVCCPNRGMI